MSTVEWYAHAIQCESPLSGLDLSGIFQTYVFVSPELNKSQLIFEVFRSLILLDNGFVCVRVWQCVCTVQFTIPNKINCIFCRDHRGTWEVIASAMLSLWSQVCLLSWEMQPHCVKKLLISQGLGYIAIVSRGIWTVEVFVIISIKNLRTWGKTNKNDVFPAIWKLAKSYQKSWCYLLEIKKGWLGTWVSYSNNRTVCFHSMSVDRVRSWC